MPEPVSRTGREIIARVVLRTVVGLLLIGAVLYIADYLLLRYKMARNQAPFGTVTVRPYYAVPRKDHKIEFMFGDPEDDACVNSLFPHMGDSPCWYLSSHKEKRVDM